MWRWGAILLAAACLGTGPDPQLNPDTDTDPDTDSDTWPLSDARLTVVLAAASDRLCLRTDDLSSAYSGQAVAGPVAVDVRVTGTFDDESAADVSGLVLTLEGGDDGELIHEATLGSDGTTTLRFTLPEPDVVGHGVYNRYAVMIDGSEEAFFVLETLPADVAFVGCLDWRDAAGEPISWDTSLRVGELVSLSFFVGGDLDGASDAGFIFKERGGDVCGPDPFGAFSYRLVEGDNDVPWRVSLEGMEPCPQEEGPSEITFSLPFYLRDGAWRDETESSLRKVAE